MKTSVRLNVHRDQRGIALITTMLVLMLISALLIGFTTVVISDQRYRFIDRDRGQAFYAASGALEKLTADLGNTFFSYLSPTNAQLTTLTGNKPTVTGVTFTATSTPDVLPGSELSSFSCNNSDGTTRTVRTVGTNGYTIKFCSDSNTNPTSTIEPKTIKTGPYEGLMALKTPFQLDVTARTTNNGEVHLVRTIEAVAIPVFQFGMFSDVDLSFFAGPNFSFGGRVHTNGNLFLSQGDNATLTLSDKVTAVKEVIRQRLQNGASIDADPTHNGTVNMAKAPGSYRALARAEGSLTDGVGSSQNENTWHTISLSTYNGYIRNSRTGAKALNLPLLTVGGTNPDLIRRPPVNENTDNAVLYNERLYTKASLRILLSDTSTDITNKPGVSTGTPVNLEGNWVTTTPAGYSIATSGAAADATWRVRSPLALSPGPATATIASTPVSTTSTINVTSSAQAQGFKPKLSSSGVFTSPITCTTKAPNLTTSPNPHDEFQGCTGMLAIANGATISTYAGVSTTMAAAATALDTVLKVANNGTNKFFPLPFFYTGNITVSSTSVAVTGVLVTCTGYTATSFTGCSGLAGPPSSGGTISSAALSDGYYTATTPLSTIGGYLKVERQDTNGAWLDVTTEFLNYGIGAPNLAGETCADPSPNAILRIQRLRDNAGGTSTTAGGGCNYFTPSTTTDFTPVSLMKTGVVNPANYIPMTLFDTREGLLRDTAPTDGKVPLGGVMHYITIDVANLDKWFRGTAPYNGGSGSVSKTDNGGYTVYFSDRRNNRNSSNIETGEYGFEDVVNPTATGGAADGQLNAGEDVNANNTLDIYGEYPNYNGSTSFSLPGALSPLDSSARPWTSIKPSEAMVNRAILFRRALKLINGSDIRGSGVTGLTIVSENPVYVQGNWNAASGDFTGTHAATSVIADAVTLLSNGWNDVADSYLQPYNPGNRTRGGDAWYRMGIIAGKSMSFTQPTGTSADFGTDGGAHNFLRFLESGNTVNYLGSIATFFYSRQATGTFKCCNTVYQAPGRAFAFDVDFLSPALLPPNTPVFRDMNAVGFSQELRPNK